MSDVYIYQTPDGGEITSTNGQLVLTEGPESAAYLSLFGGNADDSGLSGDDAKQWWGNLDETVAANRYRGQLQRLLATLPITPANLQRFEEAAASDLAWMTDSIATDLSVQATMPARNRVDFKIVIVIDGVTTSFSLRSPALQ